MGVAPVLEWPAVSTGSAKPRQPHDTSELNDIATLS
jgi:hypothetical protein